MSWVRIWIHLVFTTKERTPFLASKDLRTSVFAHIRENAKNKNIWLECVNGYQEHIHCLVSLGKEQTISKVAQLIKGESSFWINRNDQISQRFLWQDDFWAVSVSESHVQAVRKYIEGQEEHHRNKTFDDEMDEFMQKYGWKFIQGNTRKECG